jgi:hypothetical protein
LAENDIATSGKLFVLSDVIFAPVANVPSSLEAFYSWREVTPGSIPTKETWRNFLWTTGDLGINSHLSEIQISPTHTVAQVLEGFFAAV